MYLHNTYSSIYNSKSFHYKDVFVVTDSGNGTITGKSEDGRVLVFEAISDADPDTFVAQNYVKKVNGLA